MNLACFFCHLEQVYALSLMFVQSNFSPYVQNKSLVQVIFLFHGFEYTCNYLDSAEKNSYCQVSLVLPGIYFLVSVTSYAVPAIYFISSFYEIPAVALTSTIFSRHCHFFQSAK